MTTSLTVAALQLPLGSPDPKDNIAAVSALVEQAAAKGAQVVLPPELFSGQYFCKEQDEALFLLARPTSEHPSVKAMQALAASLRIAIPTSFFERDGPHHYNTMAMIGPDGGQRVYGHSFITDEWGDLVAEFGGEASGDLVVQLDLARAARHRAGMGFFRDRRPQLYGRIAQDI